MQYISARQRLIRRKRELRTIQVMIGMYCQAHHSSNSAVFCPACQALFDYATRRLERCVFGEAKPTCANCTVHCYSADKREQIREIMKWAGPRMLLKHPLLAIFHLLDGRRPAPRLAGKGSKCVAQDGLAEHSQSD